MSDPAAPWSLLASRWEELFPLRPARLDMALRLAPEGTACLDAGCATGSLCRALAARGRVAHGLDLEPAFLAHGRALSEAEGLAVTWHQAGLLDLARAAGDRRFRLVTCLGQTLPHLLEEAEWLEFFAQARAVLEPGGVLAIQVVNDAGLPVGASRDLPPLRIPGAVLERRRIRVAPDRARFETRFVPEGGEAVPGVAEHRIMGPARAADLLARAGLEPGPAWADESGAPFAEASPGWVIAARRSA